MSDPTITPASECICEDVRILGACPVHDPPTTDIASDALVAAWRYDLHRIADEEWQETPVKDIRLLMNRIEADRATILDLEQQRDQAFAMSKCECGAEEACANLARLHRTISELEAKIDSLMDPCPDCGHAMTLDDEGTPLCEMCILHATIAKQAEEIERLRGFLAALVRMHFHPDGRPYEMPAHEMRVVEDARSALSKPKE